MKFCSVENFKKIDKYIFEHKDEIVSDLISIASVPSVQGEAEDNAPFGKGCAKMLDAHKALYEKHGFKTVVKQNLGYAISYSGEEKDKKIGLFSHGDVVVPGDGWIKCKPFEPIVEGDYIFGRGVNDDKSGIIETVYAAKIIRDLGFNLKRGLVMYTGVNEETGMQDIKNYVENEQMPDVSLVCDGGYPCYSGERSMLLFSLKSKKAFKSIKSIKGGIASNIIPDKAQAVFELNADILPELEKIAGENERLSLSVENSEIILTATGISGHISASKKALNAGKVLSDALQKCSFICDEDSEILSSFASIAQDGIGTGLSIARSDEIFGELFCCNGIIDTVDGCLKLSFNCRHGLDVKSSALIETIKNVTEKLWDFDLIRTSEGYYIPDDSPLYNTILKTYESVSGETGKKGAKIAGGTHARHLKNAIPVGTVGYYKAKEITLPEGHGSFHQPDEKISISGLMEAIKILTCMIMEVDSLVN